MPFPPADEWHTCLSLLDITLAGPEFRHFRGLCTALHSLVWAPGPGHSSLPACAVLSSCSDSLATWSTNLKTKFGDRHHMLKPRLLPCMFCDLGQGTYRLWISVLFSRMKDNIYFTSEMIQWDSTCENSIMSDTEQMHFSMFPWW